MGSRSAKRVVVLFDLLQDPPLDHDYSDLFKDVAFESEKAVYDALKRLGYEANYLGLHDNLDRLIQELRAMQPDLIFNLTEAFNGRRDQSPQLAGLFELMNIPYTGTQSLGLDLAQDKDLAKKILAHHRIRIPKWVMSRHRRPLRSFKTFQFPAFVKLASEEASEGISRDSFVQTEAQCLQRVSFLHEKYAGDVIVEEYIDGREIYASVLGNKRLQVFPLREITFKQFPDDLPKFATYKTKWDEEYRKKWGIKNEFAEDVSEEALKQIHAVVKRSYEALQLKGYARFDLRLSEKGEVVVLEANPNPSLSPWDDFAKSVVKSGLSYDDLVAKLVELALQAA